MMGRSRACALSTRIFIKEIGVGLGHAVVFLYDIQRTDSLDERVAEGRKFDRDVEECSDVSSRIFESSKAARVAGALIDVVPIWPGIDRGRIEMETVASGEESDQKR